jgi:hypothetical protein
MVNHPTRLVLLCGILNKVRIRAPDCGRLRVRPSDRERARACTCVRFQEFDAPVDLVFRMLRSLGSYTRRRQTAAGVVRGSTRRTRGRSHPEM